jgi:tetratricopeptide (TPR) repeat protein
MDNRPEVLPILAEVYLALGDVERADDAARESFQLARQQKHVLASVGALDVLGMVRSAQKRWTEAEYAFDEARRTARTMGYAYGEALVLYHWGEMERRREERSAALDRLGQARDMFARLGARPDLERAEQAVADLA